MATGSKCCELAAKIVGEGYARQGWENASVRETKLARLMEQAKLPDRGWSDMEIDLTLRELSALDSNNFSANCGVGEREARIYSSIVRNRHFGFGHGIGRSGDICEVQPKAAGSSIISKLTNSMLLDTLKVAGVSRVKQCFLVPTATGMALTLCLLFFRKKRPEAKYVIWSRIDQKSCFKSIITAGFIPIIIQLERVGDELRTNMEAIQARIEELGPSSVLCVFSTTSCFAPRAHDNIPEIAQLCKHYNVPHLVNNAYGVQSSKCCYLIDEAARVGRLDFFVQSTDKNYLVPVGGAIIAGFDRHLVAELSKSYPGRASGSPTLDMFVTLLSMGSSGFKTLLSRRKNNFLKLRDQLIHLADRFKLHVLETKNNTISIAMTVGKEGKSATHLGSMLFTRGVSGTRVVAKNVKDIEGYRFEGWGSHTSQPFHAYLTASAAIGMDEEEIDIFIKRLAKVLEKAKSEELDVPNGVDMGGHDVNGHKDGLSLPVEPRAGEVASGHNHQQQQHVDPHSSMQEVEFKTGELMM